MSLPSYKNPNFFVIGVVKGGTTSLYHYLKQHPDIYLPPIKETNYFSRSDIDESKFTNEYRIDVELKLDQYFADGMPEEIHIAHINEKEEYERLYFPVHEENAIGEISNSYAICPSAAEAIKSYNPNAKIIALLRNPISRIWSHYIMNLRDAKVSKPDFIFEVQHDFNSKMKGWGISHQYIELGLYYQQVKRYLDVFGKEKCLFLLYEDFRDNPNEVLAKICKFLKVDDQFAFNVNSRKNHAALPRVKFLNKIMVKSGMIKWGKKVFTREKRDSLSKLMYSQSRVPSISRKSEVFIKDFYKKDVAKLSDLLDMDLTISWPEFKEEN